MLLRIALVRMLVASLLCFAASSRAQTPAALQAELVEKEQLVEARKPGKTWLAAPVGQKLALLDMLRTGDFSRAVVRLTELTFMRVDEQTELEILPPPPGLEKPGQEVRRGGIYFFSREKAPRMQIRTPAVNGALRGTEFALRVEASGKTTVTMFEGEVELSNASGRLLLRSGEQGEVEVGGAPRKTAVIYARNIIQWALYYPAVLDPGEFGVAPGEEPTLAASLAAYRAGDLLGALARHPDKAGRGGSTGARLYRAAVILAVGQVDKAQANLAGVPATHPGRRALEQMIAAVKFEEWPRIGEPRTASEWLASSYYEQSRSRLDFALQAARKVAALAPQSGYARARIAELEFSFGRTPRALQELETALKLAPRNAQAYAMQGFLRAAQNRLDDARGSFETAIALDGALGNAWLGRGLCSIRKGNDEAGRLDLQTAAVLEPNRSLLRSYLGKAFSQVGNDLKAHRELDRAVQLDPNDPTPWLYSALQNKQENRYNTAVTDLERSIELNDNRRVYRSQFLLDQDRSIRGTNLAAIYQNNGMMEQSVREAVRAVGRDYASAPAHLFLANSYNALRDPGRILLRYETAWFNELLLSNLLSPVGGGPLSQFVSQQEYSKMFERDGFGLSTVTDYFSSGELRETASQYGTFGNISYALDAEYQYANGLRPNNEISRFESYATFKLQLGPQDTLFFQTKFEDLQNGDLFQRYDPEEVGRETSVEVRDANGKLRKVTTKNVSALTADFREFQDPAVILAGWRHEWAPGNHTLLLVGRLANDQVLTAGDTSQIILTRDVTRRAPVGLQIDRLATDRPLSSGDVRALLGERTGTGHITAINTGSFDSAYRANFETYSGELSQIFTLGPQTLILGGRYQRGQFDTHVRLDDFDNGANPDADFLFRNPPALQNAVVDFERINLYAYDLWRLTPWLSVTAGVAYDRLRSPKNFRSPPVSEEQSSLEKVSPKAGFTLTPWRGATIRGAYLESISGSSFDESIRLEPTQVNGFLQAYRTVISESLIGSVSGSEYQFWGVSFEQKLPTRTYLGVEYQVLQQDLDRTIGVFDYLTSDGRLPDAVLPSSLDEKDSYREDILSATINQLVGDRWALGSRYLYTHSKFRRQLAGFSDALNRVQTAAFADLARNSDRIEEAGLHQLGLYVVYNHPCGFFARAEANWFRQANDNFVATTVLSADGAPSVRTVNAGLPGDEFWHFNAYAGWRFYRNQCELSCGLLNITGADYRLNQLNPYTELPRDQTFVVRAKFSF